jgi:hypothetical protein
MADPSRTWDIKTCRDVHAKLVREYKQLEAAELQNDRQRMVDTAVTFAQTAWHLADWAWAAIKDDHELRSKLAKQIGAAPQKFDFDAFRFKYLLADQNCPALRYCGAIANASKHVGVDKTTGAENITTTVSAKPATDIHKMEQVSGPPIADTLYVYVKGTSDKWTLKIIDGDERISAMAKFASVLSFWTGFIDEYARNPD